MKVNGWLAAAMATLSLAGCATVDKGAPATAASAPAASVYRMVNPVTADRLDNGAVFFLVPRDGQWSLSFDPEDFKRSGGERLAYWAEGKKTAFVFDRAGASAESGGMCSDADRDRKKRGYVVCSSAFSRKYSAGNTVFARTVVGVATGGASEVIFASKGAQFERIDPNEVLAILERLDLDRQVWLKDYRQRAGGATVSRLNDFIRRYERDDPDQLVAKAREALGALTRNASILDAAERATPKLPQYRPRFMPANPQKYCNQLKSNAEDFRYCQTAAANLVGELADGYAAAARRIDVCLAVAKAVGGGAQPAACQQYSTGACHASTPKGQQVCDILNRKGQS